MPRASAIGAKVEGSYKANPVMMIIAKTASVAQ